MKLTINIPDGSVRILDVKPGDRLMQQAKNAGVPIMGDCGGALACATCHVHIAPEWLDKVGKAPELESDLLDMSTSNGPTSRLSCQITLTEDMDGLEVTLQPDAYEG
jgi:2Fe-2S ferredoxin